MYVLSLFGFVRWIINILIHMYIVCICTYIYICIYIYVYIYIFNTYCVLSLCLSCPLWCIPSCLLLSDASSRRSSRSSVARDTWPPAPNLWACLVMARHGKLKLMPSYPVIMGTILDAQTPVSVVEFPHSWGQHGKQTKNNVGKKQEKLLRGSMAKLKDLRRC